MLGCNARENREVWQSCLRPGITLGLPVLPNLKRFRRFACRLLPRRLTGSDKLQLAEFALNDGLTQWGPITDAGAQGCLVAVTSAGYVD